MDFKDYFSIQSADYKRFRPEYPEAMIDFIVSKCKGRWAAWDCATGTGQVAAMLAPYFEKITATDGSAAQIAVATLVENINYKVCTAENSGLPDSYFDLITVGQAAHWFDLPKFYDEVKRVGKPGSVLSIWGYANHSINKTIDSIVWKLYAEILADYWPKERTMVEQEYQQMVLPFENIATPNFEIVKQVNLNDLLGYIYTWSATQQYIKKHGTNPIEIIYDELKKNWGNNNIAREIKWPVFLKMAFIV